MTESMLHTRPQAPLYPEACANRHSCNFSLTRDLGAEQMSIYKTLPFCCSTSGPEEVAGVGNFYVHVLAPAPSQFPAITLYFFDSHGERPKKAPFYRKEYDSIRESQVIWFQESSQANRFAREQHNDGDHFHHSAAFLHIPFPSFGDDSKLQIESGQRRERTEGPSNDSGLYDALAKEGIEAVGGAHDHVNDFVAWPLSDKTRSSVWLLYPGTVGYGGYCSYGGIPYHRRSRVYHFTTDGSLKTWLHVQYQENPVDHLVLVDGGEVVGPPEERAENRTCVVS